MPQTNRLQTLFLDLAFLIVVSLAIAAVSSYALVDKINRQEVAATRKVEVTVEKDTVAVYSRSRGVVQKVYAKVGQSVEQGEVIAEVTNPTLKSKLTALESYPDNISAQTEAEVVRSELQNLNILAPVSGLLASLDIVEGEPVTDYGPVGSIYSDTHTRILALLDVDEYQTAQELSELVVYSPRLRQKFTLNPDLLKPEVEKDEQTTDSKIGLYLTLARTQDAASLLHHEELELQLTVSKARSPKPVDHLVTFWNRLLNPDN